MFELVVLALAVGVEVWDVNRTEELGPFILDSHVKPIASSSSSNFFVNILLRWPFWILGYWVRRFSTQYASSGFPGGCMAHQSARALSWTSSTRSCGSSRLFHVLGKQMQEEGKGKYHFIQAWKWGPRTCHVQPNSGLRMNQGQIHKIVRHLLSRNIQRKPISYKRRLRSFVIIDSFPSFNNSTLGHHPSTTFRILLASSRNQACTILMPMPIFTKLLKSFPPFNFRFHFPTETKTFKIKDAFKGEAMSLCPWNIDFLSSYDFILASLVFSSSSGSSSPGSGHVVQVPRPCFSM